MSEIVTKMHKQCDCGREVYIDAEATLALALKENTALRERNRRWEKVADIIVADREAMLAKIRAVMAEAKD